MIFSSAVVFVLQGLARAAEAQRVLENRLNAYSVSFSKMAEFDLRVRPIKELKEKEQGSLRIGSDRFRWEIANLPYFEVPVEEGAPDLEVPLLLVHLANISWKQGMEDHSWQFHTLSWHEPPEEP